MSILHWRLKFYIANKVSTSFSSSSPWELSSHIVAVVSTPDRLAIVGSSRKSSSRSISSSGSLANGGIGSWDACWNRSVSAMCLAPTSSSWSGYYHKALIHMLMKLTCSSSFSSATILWKRFKAHDDVVPIMKIKRWLL